jgi:RNA polymerase sigma-70 factor (ECF subfamily)
MVATLLAAPDAPFDPTRCLDGVRRGEPDAARELVTACEPRVRRLVRAHRPRALGEDDLVQDVLLAIFTRLDRYTARPGIPFEHWVARLAINLCRDALRSERRRIHTVPVTTEARAWIESLLPDRQPPADETLGARQAVGALLDGLPPSDRALLTWLHLEDRSVEEIAALTGWSRTRIKVRAFRARRRLQGVARRLTAGPEQTDE